MSSRNRADGLGLREATVLSDRHFSVEEIEPVNPIAHWVIRSWFFSQRIEARLDPAWDKAEGLYNHWGDLPFVWAHAFHLVE
jgi:hypothetical protein